MDKFFIIGVRHNPQIGTYLSKVAIAKAKQLKTSISTTFEDYGSTTRIKFGQSCDIDGRHYQVGNTSCVYGSYTYYGFHDKADAIKYLETWTNASGSSKDRALAGIKAIQEA